MTILSIILGLLMISGGVTCMLMPITTFISAEYLVVILVAVFGVIGVSFVATGFTMVFAPLTKSDN